MMENEKKVANKTYFRALTSRKAIIKLQAIEISGVLSRLIRDLLRVDKVMLVGRSPEKNCRWIFHLRGKFWEIYELTFVHGAQVCFIQRVLGINYVFCATNKYLFAAFGYWDSTPRLIQHFITSRRLYQSERIRTSAKSRLDVYVCQNNESNIGFLEIVSQTAARIHCLRRSIDLDEIHVVRVCKSKIRNQSESPMTNHEACREHREEFITAESLVASHESEKVPNRWRSEF